MSLWLEWPLASQGDYSYWPENCCRYPVRVFIDCLESCTQGLALVRLGSANLSQLALHVVSGKAITFQWSLKRRKNKRKKKREKKKREDFVGSDKINAGRSEWNPETCGLLYRYTPKLVDSFTGIPRSLSLHSGSWQSVSLSGWVRCQSLIENKTDPSAVFPVWYESAVRSMIQLHTILSFKTEDRVWCLSDQGWI